MDPGLPGHGSLIYEDAGVDTEPVDTSVDPACLNLRGE